MIIRHIQQRTGAGGTTESLVSELTSPEVVIGRGGDAQIIFSSQRVSLTHAKLSFVDGALVIADQGSLTGVRVNGRRVARANLSRGDVVELGDVEIRVEREGELVTLTSTCAPAPEESLTETIARKVEQFKIERHLPAMRYICLAVIIIGVTLFLAYPFASKDFRSWNSGPISNAHKLIEADCQKCHTEPFARVQDRECLTCHQLTKHAERFDQFASKHPGLEARCATCHAEHNGDRGLINKDSDFCVSCHGSMKERDPHATVLDVASLAAHPQFRVSVRDADETEQRVSIDDTAHAVDQSQIKLNHKVHLQPGLRGKDGPVTLECSSCHQVNKDFKTLKPISFDTHCRDCHTLGFDERLPYAEVPHGDSEAVYPALFTEYTKMLLLGDDESLPNTSKDLPRIMPRGSALPNPMPKVGDVSSVVSSAREAEKQLFTRTGCFLCHSFSEKPDQERTDTNSRYVVKNPAIPSVWFSRARFSHGAHEEFSCESCHIKTRESTKTADLLLPGKELCAQCHAQGDVQGYVRSGCAECHSYHDALGIPREKKQSIDGYLRGLTR
jgi:predicted CXXCH cytochrome family protein